MLSNIEFAVAGRKEVVEMGSTLYCGVPDVGRHTVHDTNSIHSNTNNATTCRLVCGLMESHTNY